MKAERSRILSPQAGNMPARLLPSRMYLVTLPRPARVAAARRQATLPAIMGVAADAGWLEILPPRHFEPPRMLLKDIEGIES